MSLEEGGFEILAGTNWETFEQMKANCHGAEPMGRMG